MASKSRDLRVGEGGDQPGDGAVHAQATRDQRAEEVDGEPEDVVPLLDDSFAEGRFAVLLGDAGDGAEEHG